MDGRPKSHPFNGGRTRRPQGPWAGPGLQSPWAGPHPRPRPTTHHQREPHVQTRHLSYANAAGSSASNAEKEAYKTLVKEAKEKRNSLILSHPKNPSEPGASASQGKRQMYMKDWASLIFDDLEMAVDDVVAIDFHAGGPNMVEIQYADSVDPSKYLDLSYNKKGLEFKLKPTSQVSTTVSFKGVPLCVPDQELLHLIKAYGGKLESEVVSHEKVEHVTEKGVSFTVSGTTRTVNASFPPNKRLRSYYWLQGPLAKDQMRRVTVTHDGQVGRQCGHCLKSSADPIDPCELNGKTSACKEHNPNARLSLAKYFALLKQEDNYLSLKNQYMWNEADEESTKEQYSDDFEDEEPKDVAAGTTTNSLLIAPLVANWNEEPSLDELKQQLEEKEDLLAKEKAATKRYQDDLKKSRQESQQLGKVVASNKTNTFIQIKNHLDNGTDFKDFECLIPLIGNSLDLKEYSLDAQGTKAVPKSGIEPLKELHEMLYGKGVKKASGEKAIYLANNMDTLSTATLDYVSKRIKEQNKPERSRSPSISRSRSEDDEDCSQVGAKVARQDTNEEANKLSVAGPATGSSQQ